MASTYAVTTTISVSKDYGTVASFTQTVNLPTVDSLDRVEDAILERIAQARREVVAQLDEHRTAARAKDTPPSDVTF